MPGDTDSHRQKKRDALKSAWLYTLLCGGSAALLLYLRIRYCLDGFWGALALVSVLLDLGLIAPVWISFKERLKEIEGGEEDAAAEY
ncbi:MAG: hypothetical protein ACI3XG_04420 [Faecousia sp.]